MKKVVHFEVHFVILYSKTELLNKIVGHFFFKNLITLLSEKALSITILDCMAFPIRNTN